MKSALLYIIFLYSALVAEAQQVTDLPPGKYESRTKVAQNKWDRGDIIILDDERYRLSNSSETGEYKFSVAGQRIFFTSGPLKSAYTRVILSNDKPVIILPVEKNEELGLSAEIWARKQ